MIDRASFLFPVVQTGSGHGVQTWSGHFVQTVSGQIYKSDKYVKKTLGEGGGRDFGA